MRKSFYGIFVVVLCTLGLTGYALAANDLENPGFEIWTAGPGGPPDNWEESDTTETSLLATQESGTVRSGSYSVALICSTNFTRWLEQTEDVVPDSCYQFSCYAWDNDTSGTARLGIRWFDAEDDDIVGTYYGAYTSDQAAWQLMSTGSQKAPAGAVYAHCEIRMYEENYDTNWTHTTLYFDDAAFDTITCPPPSDTLSIPELQYNETTQGAGDHCYPSPYDAQVKITRGIVTQRGIADGYQDFWIQDADTAWSGVFVFQNTQTPNLGDEVVIRAQVQEYYGVTEMVNLTTYEVVSTGNPVPDPIDIVPGDLADSYLAGCGSHPERYECLLVKLTNVICAVDSAHQYAGFYVTDFAYTDTCQIDYYIYEPYVPTVGDTFLSITGIVHYSRGEYEINPRSALDIVWKTPPIPPGPAITGISWTPTLPTENDVTVMASIFDTAATVQNDSVFYQVDDTLGAWTNVASSSSSDNYYYYTIPGQDPEQAVYFYVYAENDTGGVSTSPIKKYTTTEDDQNVRINEFMYDAPGADAGCFIELHGPPGLSLNGYSLIMVNGFDGLDKKVIDLTGFSIPAEDGFFVIAQDATVPNYDMINALADFENAPDNIHLRRGGFVVDAVGYGSFDPAEYFMGETWPTYDPGLPYGFSLCRYPDGADSDYNRRDFGVYGSAYNTPGDTNLAPAEYTIKQIQDPAAKADHTGERVIVGGIVTADPVECTYNPGYYIEMSTGGGWSGVLVYDLFYEPTRGDSVQVRGTVTEEFDRTQISYVTTYNNYGVGTMPPPLPVFTSEVAAAESLEGVLVQVQSVTVTDTLGYGEFEMADGNAVGDTCMADDICGYATEVEPGDEFAIIRGVVDYSFGNFKIQPRDDNDFIEFYPADLTAALSNGAKSSSGDVYLEWTSSSAPELNYVIYRSTDPTAMGDSLDSVAPPGGTYTDVGAVGSTTTNYYYIVQARFAGGAPANSRQVGEFDKDLTNLK